MVALAFPGHGRQGRLACLGFRRHPSPRNIVHIDSDLVDVIIYTREASGDWNDTRLDQPDDHITFVDPAVSIRLADIYDGIPVATPPRREVSE